MNSWRAVVLGLLLSEAIVVFPPILGVIGMGGEEGPARVLPFSDAFAIVAYSVFP